MYRQYVTAVRVHYIGYAASIGLGNSCRNYLLFYNMLSIHIVAAQNHKLQMRAVLTTVVSLKVENWKCIFCLHFKAMNISANISSISYAAYYAYF